MNPANVLKVDLTPGVIAQSFLLAFSLAFIWATVYRKTHSGVAYTRSFFLTLMMIAPIVTMVMLAIGSNVALSLGLVGALSIIRFRTVIKDAKDMTFLFLAIGIGLCCGANAWMVAIIGTVMISLITVVMSKVGHGRVGSADYILIFRSNQKEPWSAVSPSAQDMISWKQLRGATDVDSGKEFEYTYNVRLASKASPEHVVSEFGKNGTIRQVTMIAPENHLDL
jgi:uncharacterized membrane protein YhiD involved in acid resistance